MSNFAVAHGCAGDVRFQVEKARGRTTGMGAKATLRNFTLAKLPYRKLTVRRRQRRRIPIFDLSSNAPTDVRPLVAHFTVPCAGWIRLRIEPLHDLYAISCTHIYDPFDDLLVWLEQIASGSAAATWSINQEGSASRLQFYGGVVEDLADYLLHVQSDEQGIARIRGVRVARHQLVESLYCSFRSMADDPNYQAREWEAHPQFQLLDDLDDDEYTREIRRFPYSGRNLRELTSVSLAAYLSETPDPDPS